MPGPLRAASIDTHLPASQGAFMNGDTPGASSADDFEFLGPAISRRQPEASDTGASSEEELAGPFVGGRPPTGEAADSDPDAVADGGSQSEAGDWRDDDLPWLVPADAGEEDAPGHSGSDDEPWRATGEVVEQGGGVEWGGDPVAPGEAGTEAEVARQGWDDAFGEPVAWDTGLEEGAGDAAALDIAALELDAGEEEREGFVVDSEPAGESWSEATREADPPVGMTGGAEAPWEAGRWDAEAEGEAAEVLVEESGAGDGVVPEGSVASGVAEGEGGGLGVAGTGGGGAGDALVEVADRLEGVARALREGRPLEVATDGDPLQLLVVGYALGYAQARRRGG